MTRYNTVHSSIRMHIERAFGMLKGRFRRLKYIDQQEVQTICFTICAACVLHNICIMEDDVEEVLDDNNIVPVAFVNQAIYNNLAYNNGNQKRNQITANLM